MFNYLVLNTNYRRHFFFFFRINVVSNSQIRGEAYSGGWFGPRGARCWLFMGFVLGFAALIAACWIFFADFVAGKGKIIFF